MRLSKKKRIEQHKRVYGRTFQTTGMFAGEEVTVTVKVTKLTKKGTCDRMHISVYGNIEYDNSPIDCFAHITWTKFGPTWRIRTGMVYMIDQCLVDSIVKGCESVLLE